MLTSVRKYTTDQLINRIKSLPSFGFFPDEFIIGVRSDENDENEMDDKFYHMRKYINADGEVSFHTLNVLSGTTQSGGWGFKNYFKWNKKGVAEIKADECYYDVWEYGLHKGKMPALRQRWGIVGAFKVIRKKKHSDKNTNYSVETNKGLNFHTVTYLKNKRVIKWFIGGWSVGCQVVNDSEDYYASMETLSQLETVTYFLLNEFTPEN